MDRVRPWERATLIEADGLSIAQGHRGRRFIRWSEIAGIEPENVDGECWIIMATLNTGEPVRLPGAVSAVYAITAYITYTRSPEFDEALAQLVDRWNEAWPGDRLDTQGLAQLRRACHCADPMSYLMRACSGICASFADELEDLRNAAASVDVPSGG